MKGNFFSKMIMLKSFNIIVKYFKGAGIGNLTVYARDFSANRQVLYTLSVSFCLILFEYNYIFNKIYMD